MQAIVQSIFFIRLWKFWRRKYITIELKRPVAKYKIELSLGFWR